MRSAINPSAWCVARAAWWVPTLSYVVFGCTAATPNQAGGGALEPDSCAGQVDCNGAVDSGAATGADTNGAGDVGGSADSAADATTGGDGEDTVADVQQQSDTPVVSGCVGTAGECDDANPCTTDNCDAQAKACTHVPVVATCTDGNPCTVGDICDKGTCKPGLGKTCSDGDPCTDDVCTPGTGECAHTAKSGCTAPAAPCDKSLDCSGGVCLLAKHICVPCVVTSDCGNSGYVCSKNQCKPAAACKSSADCKATGQVCDKGAGACVDCVSAADCAGGFSCVESACTAAPPCKSDKDCPNVCNTASGTCAGCVTSADCGSGMFCAGWQQCVPVACSGAKCAVLPTVQWYACLQDGSGYADGAACADSNPCTADACEPGIGCTHKPIPGPCDDGNPCTSADACDAYGYCTGSPTDCNDGLAACATGYCDPEIGCYPETDDAACDDGNVCTLDLCLVYAGCLNKPEGTKPCDADGTSCTVGDVCDSGVCVAGLPKCDDGNPCTDDTCTPASGACVSLPNSATCEDGDLCTIDVCFKKSCQQIDSVVCPGDGPCKVGVCKPADGSCGIDYLYWNEPCDDGSACTTGDVCKLSPFGACVGTEVFCNDGVACTNDSCDPLSGCVFAPTPCDDGNNCTVVDMCAGGGCKGQAVQCDDGLDCTTDNQCASDGTCIHGIYDDGTPCLDANSPPCSYGKCSQGICKLPAKLCDDGNPCTSDACNPVTGFCDFAPAVGACDVDGDPCTQDACANWQCVKGPVKDCNDGNDCTDDKCGSDGKCASSAMTDGSVCASGVGQCAIGATCQSGACKSGPAVSCDDNEPCTNDSCSPATGCKHVANTLPCDDGDACTTNDSCAPGGCTGVLFDCDDGNVCSDDGCDAVAGCVHSDNTQSCSDPAHCPAAGVCNAGKCVAGGLNCDDGYACTIDTCVANSCIIAQNTCDDKNPCTVDSCDPAAGCIHTVVCVP